MGRIKSTTVKRVTQRIVELHRPNIKKTFDENKLVVSSVADVPSKKTRNIIAGYLTRQANSKKDF